MADKKKGYFEEEDQDLGEIEPVEIKAEPFSGSKIFYTVENWKGVRDVFKCASCQAFRDTKEQIIQHLVTHYPVEERVQLSEQLLKE